MACRALHRCVELDTRREHIKLFVGFLFHSREKHGKKYVVVSLKKSCNSHGLLSSLGIKGVEDVVKRKRLRWFGHMERKDKEDLVSKCSWKRKEVMGEVGEGNHGEKWFRMI